MELCNPGPTYDVQLMHNGAHISTMGADGQYSRNNLQWLATILVATFDLDLIANRKETNQYYLYQYSQAHDALGYYF